jgi:signal transduction histidine kinase
VNTKERVLVIDDEQGNLEVLRRILEQQGLVVETALDGREGLEKAKSLVPDLILLDVFMPGDDGITVCGVLKAHPLTQAIPVIIMTAFETDSVRLACLQAGANEFLGKPFSHTELVLRVRNLLQLRQAELLRRQAEVLAHTSDALAAKNRELEEAFNELQMAQSHLLQSEKMASIGQLAAGVAHEINNPVGFIHSNLSTLGKYLGRFAEYIAAQQAASSDLAAEARQALAVKAKELKIEYSLQDARELIAECLDGTERVKEITTNLKNFSRIGNSEQQAANLNTCLDETLRIVWNELKYKATVIKEYGELPETVCYPQQLNQVFVNILVNAAQAIIDQGEIRIRTWCANGLIFVAISDTGPGIPESIQHRLFEPFFTTKEVGKGTGLGLSISYEIVRKHGGVITLDSEAGRGTTFTLQIPVRERDGSGSNGGSALREKR